MIAAMLAFSIAPYFIQEITMGQAKRRGTFEERKAQAIERDRRLEEAIPSLPEPIQKMVKRDPKRWGRALGMLLKQ